MVTLPGGAVEKGETLEQAVIRETKWMNIDTADNLIPYLPGAFLREG
ncbi:MULTISPECIES: NUDIX hydrolase [Fictibacillus]|nr:NUDIX hydrolase [Fictibacillus sp. 26RED30]